MANATMGNSAASGMSAASPSPPESTIPPSQAPRALPRLKAEMFSVAPSRSAPAGLHAIMRA